MKHLRGMFAFAIWDRRKRVLFAPATGWASSLFTTAGTARHFCSVRRSRRFSHIPDVAAEFNRGTLAEYLAFGYITGPETMFAGIRKLMPGHTLELAERGEPQDRALLGSHGRSRIASRARANTT